MSQLRLVHERIRDMGYATTGSGPRSWVHIFHRIGDRLAPFGHVDIEMPWNIGGPVLGGSLTGGHKK